MLTLLIAEDEMNTRKELADFDWNKIGYTVCAAVRDGAEALAYMEKNPVDVVLTDVVMPNMTGLQLVEQIRNRGMSAECVILSAYDNFAFAQAAIRLKVSQYLLKPLSENELYSLFSSIRDRILSDRQRTVSDRQRQQLLESSDVDLAEKALENYLKRLSWQEETISLLLSYYSCIGPGDSFALGLFDYATSDYIREKSELCAWYRKHLGRTCVTFPWDRYNILLLSFPKTTDIASVMQSLCAEKELRMLLSSVSQGLSGLPERFEQLTAGKDKLFLMHHAAFESTDGPSVRTAPMPDTRDYAKLIAGAVRTHKENEPAVQITRFTAQLADALPSSEAAVLSFTELCRVTSDLLTQDGKEPLLSFNDIFQKLNSCASLQELQKETGCLMASLYEKYNEQNILNLADRIRKYVDEHYSEPLAVSDIASKFYFSENYIGTLFKQETGIALSQYIRNVRLKKARNLLIETGCYVRNISTQTGFANYRTFCRLFKEEYGMTPVRYRALHHKDVAKP